MTELDKCRDCPKWDQNFNGYMEGVCDISGKIVLGHYECKFGRYTII